LIDGIGPAKTMVAAAHFSQPVFAPEAFKGKRFYNVFLAGGAGISTNILSGRLKKMEQLGIINSEKIKQKQIRKEYSLTEKGKDLIPILIAYIIWPYKYDPEMEAGQEFVQEALKTENSIRKAS
ncbi:MAG: DNA-binding HxlR family transcriptional regulator, partial [Luteibaculaceae bacterium]